MTRHAKNNSAGAHFTYAERQQLRTRYGTQSNRLHQDSLRTLTDCWLCLQTASQEPMACAEGHVACKECWLKSLLEQRQAYKRETEKQLEAEQARKLAEREAEQQTQLARIADFERQQDPTTTTTSSSSSTVKKQVLALPGPKTSSSLQEKFVSKCMVTKHAVSWKTLTPIKWTLAEKTIVCPLCLNPLAMGKATLHASCSHVVCQGCSRPASSVCEHCERPSGQRISICSEDAQGEPVVASHYTPAFHC